MLCIKFHALRKVSSDGCSVGCSIIHQAHQILTDRMVGKIEPTDKRQMISDPELPGHYIRVTPAGAKTYCCMARDPAGKQVLTTLGRVEHMAIADAREKAKQVFARIKLGQPAVETPVERPITFGEVAEEWFTRHIEGRGVITASDYRGSTSTFCRRGGIVHLSISVAVR
jgi:Arm DNA-binding domain